MMVVLSDTSLNMIYLILSNGYFALSGTNIP